MSQPSFKVNVAFQNVSTLLSADELRNIVAALQVQASEHFGPAYGVDANLSIITSPATLQAEDWLVIVGDTSDQLGALGYHELTPSGQPLGKVFALSDRDDGMSPSVTCSHELLEMLADPWANLISQGVDGNLRAYEVCDAVEDDSFGYEIDGGFGPVLVSDFVLPAWFNSTPGPYDHQGHCDAPLKLLAGGYIGMLNGTQWTQITAKRGSADRAYKKQSRRFALRKMPKHLWSKSKS